MHSKNDPNPSPSISEQHFYNPVNILSISDI